MSASTSKARSRREAVPSDCEKSFVRNDPGNSGKPFWKRIVWFHWAVVFGVPMVAVYGLSTIHCFAWKTWLWAALYYFWTTLGITAGYHRLWAHKSYTASKPLELFLLFGGSGALEGSARWWCLLHRAHHRWTDTDRDPYNIRRGFLYAHCGWLLMDPVRVDDDVDISDLRRNRMLEWQRSNYLWFAPVATFIFPTLVAYLFCDGDMHGGFFIAGVLRLLFVHHATWFVNSLAHYIGSSTFDDTISPKDSIITAFVTQGEGYHNFHHEFPNDFRNGIKWFDYDPTKWFIRSMWFLGLASNLRTFSQNEIEKGECDMMEKNLKERKKAIDYGVDVEQLPVWSEDELRSEVAKAIKNSRVWIIEAQIVHDVTEFVASGQHPGGKSIILSRNGKDVTDDFNGTVYNHTNAARNLMSHWRIARLR